MFCVSPKYLFILMITEYFKLIRTNKELNVNISSTLTDIFREGHLSKLKVNFFHYLYYLTFSIEIWYLLATSIFFRIRYFVAIYFFHKGSPFL